MPIFGAQKWVALELPAIPERAQYEDAAVEDLKFLGVEGGRPNQVPFLAISNLALESSRKLQ